MPEMALSATETALENQRIGGLQIRVAALCTLIQICDGYDVNSIGWAVPSLTHVWNLPGPAFTTAFLWSSIGIMVGALSAGPIGDRIGRKPLLLASVTIFGLASLLSGFAPSLGVLAILRFFTGLGIGGAFPGAATLAGDYAPHRLRATMIMATFTGAPVGGFVGGQIVAVLLPHFGWPVIFILGGAFPLVLVAVLALWLPESPRFLARKANLSPRQAALLERLDIAPGQVELHPVDIAHSNPVKMLFGEGYALQTVLLWVIFFCSLMNLFLFGYWLPEVLHLIGMTPAGAVFASSLRDLGAILAVLYLGLLIDRVGPERSLAFHYAIGAVFIAVISLVALPYAMLLAIIWHDDYRQPDRRQRDLRQALPGAHADERPRLGARHRPPGRHRCTCTGRLSTVLGNGADTHLFECLSVRSRRRRGDGIAGIARRACRTLGRPIHRLMHRCQLL